MNGHEPNTTNVRWLLISLGLLVAILLISELSVGALTGVLNHVERRGVRPGQAVAVPAKVQIWQKPLTERAEIERQARERISGYGWVDRQAGIVRIPIDRAMQLLAEKPATQEDKP